MTAQPHTAGTTAGTTHEELRAVFTDHQRHRQTRHLALTLVCLQIFDILTTIAVIHAGGYEANPVIAPLIARFGPLAGLIVVKVFAVATILCIRTRGLLRGACAVYGLIVGWNLLLWIASVIVR